MVKKFIIGSFLIVGVFLAGEFYLHTNKPSLVEFDQELGWKLKSNFDRTYAQTTQNGVKYNARFQTNEYGFRTYGDNNEQSKKILVLGDSFTGDSFSSNNEAWFAILAQTIESNLHLSPNSITVWAGGSGGYGTLQELLLAKRIKNHFKPDMLILQFCSNDFEDNHLQWQSNTFLRQLYLRRPFRNTKGEIEFSQSFFAPIYRSYIFQKSRILNKLDTYINFFEYRYLDGYSNKISTDLEKIYQDESVMITQSLLKDLSNQFPDIARVMVNCSTEKNSLNGQLEWLAQNAGFTLISEPTKVVESGLSKGNDLVHSDGGHWNPMGNKLFGESLYQSLKDLGLIDSLLLIEK